MAVVAASALLASSDARATPAFARKQNMACPVCHTAFPELNEVGREFKDNGYRFRDPKTKQDVTAGTDLGGGILIDTVPGIAFRVESVVAEVAPNAAGDEAVTTQPLDAAELIAAGVSGSHWSYMAEIASEAENDYVPAGNGIIQFRAVKQLSLFAGWVPMFQRDGYNSLSESRRIDHVGHAVGDYAGSIDANVNEESGVLGATGRFGPVFYIAETTPGPGIVPSEGEPMDYLGRLEFDLTKKIGVGGFVYSGNTATDSTVRAALDFNALTTFGTFKAVGMYDTLDQAVAVEGGWDIVEPAGKFTLIPQGRFDLTDVTDTLAVVPMIGFGVQHSAGRVSLELSDELGSGSPPPPTAALILDGVF